MSQQVKVYRELQFLGAATGIHNIVLLTNRADALSVKDSAGDLIVFKTTTGSQSITITPATTITGAITGSSTISSTGPTSGIGYATGAGGTVTQGTSKSTGVTLSKVTGVITMHNAELAAATSVGFTVTNTTIAATDIVVASIASGATAASYTLTVDAVAAGSFKLSLRNETAGALSEAVVINFAVIKGVNA